MGFNPAKTSQARSFFLTGGANPGTSPAYRYNIKLGGVTMALGDVTPIYMPDPSKYGSFIEVGVVEGNPERATATLTGVFSRTDIDELLAIARRRCSFDLQLHFGACSDPSNPNTFDKAIVMEGVSPTQYSTDDLSALNPDENGEITTSLDISAKSIYEILPIDFAQYASTLIDTAVVDIIAPNVSSCGGECENAGDSTDFIVVLKQSDATQNAALVYSIDGGNTWYTSVVSTQAATNIPVVAVGATSDYLLVFEANGNYHYAERSQFDGVSVPAWTSVAFTGNVADAWSVSGYVFAAGDDGAGNPQIMSIRDAEDITYINVNATANALTAIHAPSVDFIIAGGASGVVVYSNDGGDSFIAATPLPSGADVSTIWSKTDSVFIAADVNGNLYYSTDTGKSWNSTRTFSASYVADIYFATGSVGYYAISDGRLYRTYDGGNSLVRMPDGKSTMPTIATFTAVYGAMDDVNFVVTGGNGGLVIGK